MTSPTPPTTESSPTPTQAPAGGGRAGSSSDNTKAIVTLVLGILSLICCGFFTGIPAIFVGKSELKAIDEGRSPETNRSLAKVGFILGIIGTILSCLGALAYGAIIAIAIITGTPSPSSF